MRKREVMRRDFIKSVVMLAFIVFATGCASSESPETRDGIRSGSRGETSQSTDAQESSASRTGNYDASDFQFNLEGIVYEIPCKVSDFTENGWELAKKDGVLQATDKIPAFSTSRIYIIKPGIVACNIGICNFTEGELPLDECDVFLFSYDIERNKNIAAGIDEARYGVEEQQPQIYFAPGLTTVGTVTQSDRRLVEDYFNKLGTDGGWAYTIGYCYPVWDDSDEIKSGAESSEINHTHQWASAYNAGRVGWSSGFVEYFRLPEEWRGHNYTWWNAFWEEHPDIFL